MKRRKKSKFQERLDKIQKEHREKGNSGPGNISLHNENPGDPGDSKSQTARRPDLGWISILIDPPPYYVPVDLWITGVEVEEDWHRVSDGDNDYYCNPRDNSIITDPVHWAKRPGVKYDLYDPMTGDDIKQITYRELLEVRDTLEKEMIVDLGIEYHEGFNAGLLQAIKTINNLIRTKRMT